MRVKKRTIAAALSLAMMLGLAPAGIPQAGTPFSVTAQAAKKKVVKKKKKTKKTKKKAYKENPRLSKMKISLRNKKMTTVRVSGTKKGISVSTSDRSIASVSKSGKYAFRIKAAKKKKGIAVIRVKTSRGYRYVFVQVGGRTNMSGKTRAWAQTAGFIRVAVVQSSTPVAQNPVTVPTIPIQQQQKPTVTQPETQAQTQPETIQNRYKDYGNGVTRGDDGYYYYNGRAYFTKEDADYDRLSEINNAISAVPAEYPYTYKFSQEELELLKNRGELNGVAYSQYEALQDQKKNGSFYAVLDQYRDYCKNYDKQIMIKCGMTASQLSNPESMTDQQKFTVLRNLAYYISNNIPYLDGDPSRVKGGENDYFFYPKLWQALTDQGYVSERNLGYGWSCNGTAYKMMHMSYEWLHTKMYWVSVPEHSINGKNGMHGGAAILLKDISLANDGSGSTDRSGFKGDTWLIFEPGYSMDDGINHSWAIYSTYTAPIISDPASMNYKFYSRCIEAKNQDNYKGPEAYPYWAYDYEKGWYHA